MKGFIDKLIERLGEESYTIHLDGFIASTEKKIVEFTDVQKTINELTEEYKDKDCSKCSRRSWYQKGYSDAEKKFTDK